MENYLTTKCFTVKKISKTDRGWVLYFTDRTKPLLISYKYYDGQMPSAIRLFFMRPILELTYVLDIHIVGAKLDGKELFRIKPEEYSEETKQDIVSYKKRRARLEPAFAVIGDALDTFENLSSSILSKTN